MPRPMFVAILLVVILLIGWVALLDVGYVDPVDGAAVCMGNVDCNVYDVDSQSIMSESALSVLRYVKGFGIILGLLVAIGLLREIFIQEW